MIPILHKSDWPNAELYRGVRVAVFGASGFIGGWVARYLTELGAYTYLFVRNRLEAERELSGCGVRGEYVESDILDFDSVSTAMRRICPVITFDLVGYGVRREQVDETLANRTNWEFLERLANVVSKIRCDDWLGLNLIHVGSALEYGSADGNLEETETVPNPETVYGKSKLAGTRALSRHCQATGMSGLTARLFTVYGPREPKGRLLPTLFEHAGSQLAVELTLGDQLRDFTYVEDVAQGLVRLGVAQAEPGAVVNLATGKLSSVRSFAEIGANILGVPRDQLVFGALRTRPEEMRHGEVSIDRLKNLVNWYPKTSIENGIYATANFNETKDFNDIRDQVH